MMANLFRGGGLGNLFRGVYFNGSTVLRLSQVIGSDSSYPNLIFSCWYRMKATATAHKILLEGKFPGFTGSQPFSLLNFSGSIAAAPRIRATDRTSTLAYWYAQTPYAYNTGWHHLLCGTTGGVLYYYMDGDPVNVTKVTDILGGGAVANLDWSTWSIGQDYDAGWTPMVADIAELYYTTADWVDITQESNRRKFVRADGTPEDLGSDGSTPTGTAPKIYLSLRSGYASVNEFLTNRGSGNNFSVVSGSLSEATDQPQVGV